MAKKGGVQQLQADIQTDEEFDKFIERPGLLVLDVYSEWCGPCLGMVGSLRKIKLELGGDNLQLAICKADTISYLKRFQKKSEPTWLFVKKGMAINIMFGTDVPKLMSLITTELHNLHKTHHEVYKITDLQPEEVKRRKVREDAVIQAKNKEEAAKKKQRSDYLTYVTDTVRENLPDIGVTVFGPQVSRDMYKKILEPAEALKLQCKDRRVVMVNKSDFDVVNFACPNPLPEEVLEQFDQKEIMMCFWKMPDDDRRPIPEILNSYANELTKKRVEPADEYNEEERVIGPVIAPLDLTVEVELNEGEEWEDEPEPEPEVKPDVRQKQRSVLSIKDDEGLNEGDENGEDEDEGDGDDAEPMDDLDLDFDLDLDLDLDKGNDELGEEEEEENGEEQETAVVEVKRYRKKVIRIPAIWVANNQRTHAALIYVFFRQQTAGFLPPDPVPEPPHVVMAFDAYKKRDLMALAERYKEDVPLYGFFSSDEAQEAKYISNSAEKYAKMDQNANDKLIFKINKQTSHTMLAFATYGPSYVSPNTEIGHEEALKFFPESFKTPEQEALDELEREAASPKRKIKLKRKADDAMGSFDASAAAEPAATSGEDSGESNPPPATGDASATEEPPPGDDAGAAQEAEGESPPAAAEAASAPGAEGDNTAPADAAPAEAEAAPAEAVPSEEPPAEAPPEEKADAAVEEAAE